MAVSAAQLAESRKAKADYERNSVHWPDLVLPILSVSFSLEMHARQTAGAI